MLKNEKSAKPDAIFENLPYQNAMDLVAALANQKMTSVALLEQTIARIEQFDTQINAVVVRDFDAARKSAIEADKAILRGEKRPLLGLPMTVKESFCVKGLPKSWGNATYKGSLSKTDALSVARLKAAGAIIIGKSNVPTMLKDWQTYNDVYGTTHNPYDTRLTPGGSSGGGAAALAAGFVALELGSDMAGSLRAPAHFCGVFSHRPTFNLIPTRGANPPGMEAALSTTNDFSVIGPMARSAQDLMLALDILAGPDAQMDGKAYSLCLPKARHAQLSDFRVLIIDSHPLFPISKVVKESITHLADRLGALGAKVSRQSNHLPCLKKIAQNYGLLFASLTSEALPVPIYEEKVAMASKLAKDDMRFSSCFLRGFALSHRDWLKAMRERYQLLKQWRNLYHDVDVVLCPVMPTPAFAHDHTPILDRTVDIDGVAIAYTDQHVWFSVSGLFGLPATIAPIHRTTNGLPIGIQIIGDHLDDRTTLMFAKLLEDEIGGFVPPNMRF